MTIGNDFVGLATDDGYHAIKMYPFGFELCFFNSTIQIAFIFFSKEISIALKKNYSLFVD